MTQPKSNCEKDPNCLIIEYEVFNEHLRKITGLRMIVEKLGRYGWLPVEGEDFEIKMDAATVNGITIEGQTYHTL